MRTHSHALPESIRTVTNKIGERSTRALRRPTSVLSPGGERVSPGGERVRPAIRANFSNAFRGTRSWPATWVFGCPNRVDRVRAELSTRHSTRHSTRRFTRYPITTDGPMSITNDTTPTTGRTDSSRPAKASGTSMSATAFEFLEPGSTRSPNHSRQLAPDLGPDTHRRWRCVRTRSPAATPRRKHCAPSSAGSATPSTGNSSPTRPPTSSGSGRANRDVSHIQRDRLDTLMAGASDQPLPNSPPRYDNHTTPPTAGPTTAARNPRSNPHLTTRSFRYASTVSCVDGVVRCRYSVRRKMPCRSNKGLMAWCGLKRGRGGATSGSGHRLRRDFEREQVVPTPIDDAVVANPWLVPAKDWRAGRSARRGRGGGRRVTPQGRA